MVTPDKLTPKGCNLFCFVNLFCQLWLHWAPGLKVREIKKMKNNGYRTYFNSQKLSFHCSSRSGRKNAISIWYILEPEIFNKP